jgi:hypothetical protein
LSALLNLLLKVGRKSGSARWYGNSVAALGPERRQRICNHRHAVGPIVTAPGEHAPPIAIAPADEPEAVVFNLVGPLLAGRHSVAKRRQAWLDKAGWTASGIGGAPEHRGVK